MLRISSSDGFKNKYRVLNIAKEGINSDHCYKNSGKYEQDERRHTLVFLYPTPNYMETIFEEANYDKYITVANKAKVSKSNIKNSIKLKMHQLKKKNTNKYSFGIGLAESSSHGEVSEKSNHQNEDKQRYFFPKRSLTLLNKLAYKNKNVEFISQHKKNYSNENQLQNLSQRPVTRHLSLAWHLKICSASTTPIPRKNEEIKKRTHHRVRRNKNLCLQIQEKLDQATQVCQTRDHENLSPWDIIELGKADAPVFEQ